MICVMITMLRICLFGLLLLLATCQTQMDNLEMGLDGEMEVHVNTSTKIHYPPKQVEPVFGIDLVVLNSTDPGSKPKCERFQREVYVAQKAELLRLSSNGKEVNRKERVYEKLTQLVEQKNIILQVQKVGDGLFVVTTDGNGYFVPLNPSTEQTQTTGLLDAGNRVETTMKWTENTHRGEKIVLIDLKGRALVLAGSRMVVCKKGQLKCEEVQGLEPVSGLREAYLIEEKSTDYIFLLTRNEVIYYELTANLRLESKRVLNEALMGVRLSPRSLYRPNNKGLLLLDDTAGLRWMSTESSISSMKPSFRTVYRQYGCTEMVGFEDFRLTLGCSPQGYSSFILKLVKRNSTQQKSYPEYDPVQTNFLSERVYQVHMHNDLLIGRVFSGFRTFFSTDRKTFKYPYFHREAGNFFLNNVIQSRLIDVNGTVYLIMAAEDEIIRYTLDIYGPWVECASTTEAVEQYEFRYHSPCPLEVQHQSPVCQYPQRFTFKAWEHTQIKVASMLLPLVLSAIGVVLVCLAVWKIGQKYRDEVDSARTRYDIQLEDI